MTLSAHLRLCRGVFAAAVATALFAALVAAQPSLVDSQFGNVHALTKDAVLNVTLNFTATFPADGVTGAEFAFEWVPFAPWLSMGTADTYGIIAYSAITNTGASVVYGDVGLFPMSSVDGGISIIDGVLQKTTATADTAIQDANTAKVTLQGQPCTTTFGAAVNNIGGMTLAPGVYCFPTADILFDGADLTFDAQGDINAHWVIKVAGTFTVGDAGVVRTVIINGGSLCNIYWSVGQQVTIYASSVIHGTMISATAVALNLGAIIHGRAFGLNAAVTLQANTIDNSQCDPTPDIAPWTFANVAITAASAPSPSAINATMQILSFVNVADGGFTVSADVNGSLPNSIRVTSPELSAPQLATLAVANTTAALIFFPDVAGWPAVIIPASRTFAANKLSAVIDTHLAVGSFYFFSSNASIVFSPSAPSSTAAPPSSAAPSSTAASSTAAAQSSTAAAASSTAVSSSAMPASSSSAAKPASSSSAMPASSAVPSASGVASSTAPNFSGASRNIHVAAASLVVAIATVVVSFVVV